MQGTKQFFIAEPHYSEEFGIQDVERCALGISVGAHFNEGAKLLALVHWISARFKHCTVLVCDTLQRYNLEQYGNGNEEAALRESRLNGDLWLERNKETLEAFRTSYTVSRWDSWRTHPGIAKVKASLEKHYQAGEGFRRAVDDDVSRYINNNPLPEEHIERAKRFSLGVEYLLEELAGLELFTASHGHLEVYAGAKMNSTEFLCSSNLQKEFPNLCARRGMKLVIKKTPRAVST